jgi:heme oxygenase (biliverdin-producing, ferredoxin)
VSLTYCARLHAGARRARRRAPGDPVQTTTTTRPATGLAAALRAGTAEAHEAAESEAFVHHLLAGHLDRDAYARMLAQLHPVYVALAAPAPAVAADPTVAALRACAPDRVGALEADLEDLLGADWQERHPPLDATRAYVDRLRVAAHDVPAFVAHHYTRVLGDLAGGQVIRDAAVRSYGVPVGAGTRFLTHGGPDPLPHTRTAYRAALDATGWDDDTVAACVDEARVAFGHNRALLAALAVEVVV